MNDLAANDHHYRQAQAMTEEPPFASWSAGSIQCDHQFRCAVHLNRSRIDHTTKGEEEVKNILIAMPLLLATACAAPPVQRDKAADEAAIRAAIRQENACGMTNAPSIDDGISDAATVALALALRCHNEYAATTEVVCATLGNDAQREMMRDWRNTNQNRVEAFLPEVMRHRQQMR